MPELRKDPIAARWVIIATERARRPQDFSVAQNPPRGGPCAFCEGGESQTPPEILCLRNSNSHPNEPGWRLRVVPNKFPALRIEGDLTKRGNGIYDMINGVGAHEVIVEAPQHALSLSALSQESVRDVVWAYRERLADLKKDVRFIYGLVFKNVGDAAGASLEHTHSQLIVTPIVPELVQREMAGGKQFYDYRGRCIFCDMIQQEIQEGIRVVENDPNFVAFCPYASRFPFETWILPKRHSTRFEVLPDTLLGELARILRVSLIRIDKALNSPPYNYLLHTGPFDLDELEYYHWHIEIIPRITRVAGYEWGTGFYINPMAPENAAQFLREVDVK